MSKREAENYLPWSIEEEEYLKKRVVTDKVHPMDVMTEINEKFKTNRSEQSIVKKCQRLGVQYDGYATEKAKRRAEDLLKKNPQVIGEVIGEDVREVRLKEKLQEIGSKYEVLIKEKSLEERLVSVIKEEVKALPEVKRVWRPSVEKVSQETAILLLGDTHIGEVVSREEVCGFGEYDFDIFVKRLKFLADSIKSITVTKLKGYRIDKLVIYVLGDMISGRVHEELREKGEEIIFQVLQGSFVTAQFILELSQLFSDIEIVGVVGNHGRLTQKPTFKRKYVCWDYIFYQFLSMFLVGNSRIKCNFPKSFFTLHKIYDWTFLLLHGDNIRSWLGISWYGVDRAVYRLGDLLQGKGERVDYRILGHFHNSGALDKGRGEIIINGSVIGGTEYSLGRLFLFDRPTQLFMGCHKEIGVVWRYPMRLDLPGVNKVEPYAYNQDFSGGDLLRELLKKKGDLNDCKEKER